MNTKPTFLIKTTLLSWFAMIGFDFFLHAGLLADLYAQDSPFLLPSERAFALIPVGYASFLLLAILLTWLMARLEIRGWRDGGLFGLKLGGLAWGALVLGLYSIATASPALLIGWFAGQTAELGIAGLITGHALAVGNLRRLTGVVSGLVFILLVVSILLQNIS